MQKSKTDCTTQSSMGTPCPPAPIVLRSGSCHRFFRHPRRVRPRSFAPFARGPIHTQRILLWCVPSLAAAPVPSCPALPAFSCSLVTTLAAHLGVPAIALAGPARARVLRTLPLGAKGLPAAQHGQRPPPAAARSAQAVDRAAGPWRPHAASGRRAASVAVLMHVRRRRAGGDCCMR